MICGRRCNVLHFPLAFEKTVCTPRWDLTFVLSRPFTLSGTDSGKTRSERTMPIDRMTAGRLEHMVSFGVRISRNAYIGPWAKSSTTPKRMSCHSAGMAIAGCGPK